MSPADNGRAVEKEMWTNEIFIEREAWERLFLVFLFLSIYDVKLTTAKETRARAKLVLRSTRAGTESGYAAALVYSFTVNEYLCDLWFENHERDRFEQASNCILTLLNSSRKKKAEKEWGKLNNIQHLPQPNYTFYGRSLLRVHPVLPPFLNEQNLNFVVFFVVSLPGQPKKLLFQVFFLLHKLVLIWGTKSLFFSSNHQNNNSNKRQSRFIIKAEKLFLLIKRRPAMKQNTKLCFVLFHFSQKKRPTFQFFFFLFARLFLYKLFFRFVLSSPPYIFSKKHLSRWP